MRAANKQVAQCEREVRAAQEAYVELNDNFRGTKSTRDVSILFNKLEGTKGSDGDGEITLRVSIYSTLL